MDNNSYPKIVYQWNVTQKEFKDNHKEDFDNIFKNQNLPSVDENAKNDKFAVAFHDGFWYLQIGKDVMILVENKINPIDFYPKWYKFWDSIPRETVIWIIAAKLWFPFEAIEKMINGEWEFMPDN